MEPAIIPTTDPETLNPRPNTDTVQLQDVLTRYVDSRDGYIQSAEVVKSEGLSESFKAIAERREAIAGRVAKFIEEQGIQPDLTGSPEAGLHRWWIRLKEQMTDQDTDSLLKECIRGEEELAKTLHSAIDSHRLESAHLALLQEVLSEVELAIRSFHLAVSE